MKTKVTALCGGLLALGLAAQAQQISFSSGGSLTAWNGTPSYYSSLLENAQGPGLGATGTATSLTGTYGGIAETFTPSSSFNLGSIGMLLSVNNTSNPAYQINLYDLGPAGTVSVSSIFATFTAGTSLFSANTISGFSATGGEVQGLFTLPTVDQVTLNANEEYAIAIWVPAADGSSGVSWYRNSLPPDPGGQMFCDGDDVNDPFKTLEANGLAGGAPRTGLLALYAAAPAPEPATLTLFGLGGLAVAFAIGRRKV